MEAPGRPPGRREGEEALPSALWGWTAPAAWMLSGSCLASTAMRVQAPSGAEDQESEGNTYLEDKCLARAQLPGSSCKGTLREERGSSPTKREATSGSSSPLPVPPDGLLPGLALPSLTAHQAGQNPTTLQVGPSCCQWQRRMTYLSACQALPCLWKAHPAKQNSLLPIGSSPAPVANLGKVLDEA